MPRTVSRRLTRRGSAPTPQSQGSPGYSPQARLVGMGDGAARSAAQVAQSLQQLVAGVGQVGAGIFQDRNESLFNRGETDARTGTVDESKMGKWPYADAVELVQTEAALIKDRREISEGAKPFIDSGDAEGLDAFLQQEANLRWGGVTDNAAKLVNPFLSKLREELLGHAADSAAKIQDQENVANLTEVATGFWEDAAATDGNFDYAGFHARVLEIYGPKGAWAVEAPILENLIKNKRAFEIYDRMPDRNEDGTPTIKLDPNFGQALRNARDEAYRLREAGKAADMGKILATKLNEYNEADAAGRQIDWNELMDGAHLGLWDYSFVASRFEQNRRAMQARLDKAADVLDLSEAFRSRTHHALSGKHSQEDMDDEFDRYLESYGPPSDDPNFAAWVVQESEATGYAYRPWVSEFTNVNFEDPQRLDGVVQKFDAIYAKNPNVARKYVKNDQDFQNLVIASTLKKYGIDPAQRLAALGTVDLSKRRQEFMDGNVRKQAQASISKAELTRPGGIFDPDIAKMPASTQAFYGNELGKLIDALGTTGVFENADALVEAANKMMQSRFVIAGEKMIPRTKDMPADADAAMTWFVKEGVNADLTETGLTAADVELVADTRTGYDGTYRLVLKGGIEPVLPDRRYRVNEIAEVYRGSVDTKERQPFQRKWDAVISNKAVQSPTQAVRAEFGRGTPARPDAPSVTQYVAERKYLRPDQIAALDARLLPQAEAELAKAADRVAYAAQRAAERPADGWAKHSVVDPMKSVKDAQKKVEFWSKAVEAMKAPKAAPQAPPAAAVNAAPAASQGAGERVVQGAYGPITIKAKNAQRPWYDDPWEWQGNPKSSQYRPLIEAAEQAYGLPPGLLGAVAQKESAYNPNAKSRANALGLMQIVPRWHPGVNPLDWKQAIPYAAKYLSDQYKTFGSWDKALAAYNMGPGSKTSDEGLMAVLRKHGDNWFSHVPLETRDYVRRLAPRPEMVASTPTDQTPVS